MSVSDTSIVWFGEDSVDVHWKALPDLRWKCGILEQAFEVKTITPNKLHGISARIEWKAVPSVEESPSHEDE